MLYKLKKKKKTRDINSVRSIYADGVCENISVLNKGRVCVNIFNTIAK